MTRTLLSSALLALVCPPALGAEDARAGARTARARALVEALAKKDYAKAGADFDATMKKVLPEAKRKEVWEAVLEQVGPLRKQLGTRAESKDGYQIVYVTCRFARMDLDVRVVFDKDDSVSGLRFLPAKGTFAFRPPPYARPDSFTESDVVVNKGEKYPLPGTLALPKGEGPFPGVVLLHGSGPHDRDETIGPNKPLRDLAWGLASRGLAVLRFEKRTHAHGKKLVDGKDPLTFKEEVVDDALAAAALLRKQKGVDPRRVFVLGHSLGATVAPEVGARDPHLAGLIILAGNTRPLEDLVLEQVSYILSLKGKLSEKDRERLEELKKQVARVKDHKLSPDTPAKELPLGAPAPYWLALRAYDPAKTAARLKVPMLILQGERDYQVTMDDFAGWKKALAGRKDVVLKSYPKLNHLFMEGEGKAKPEEYSKEGHVAGEVIDDVAEWVKKR